MVWLVLGMPRSEALSFAAPGWDPNDDAQQCRALEILALRVDSTQ